METAVATPADTTVPFPLRDVEDLHEADLDAVLADRLADAATAVASASALVALLDRSRPAALAHTLGAQALLLAVR